MRTTLEIDDGVLAVARALARDSGVSLGAAVSVLAQRGLTAAPVTEFDGDVPVFAAPTGAPPITLDVVNAHRDG